MGWGRKLRRKAKKTVKKVKKTTKTVKKVSASINKVANNKYTVLALNTAGKGIGQDNLGTKLAETTQKMDQSINAYASVIEGDYKKAFSNMIESYIPAEYQTYYSDLKSLKKDDNVVDTVVQSGLNSVSPIIPNTLSGSFLAQILKYYLS
jgi:hypothetical protein